MDTKLPPKKLTPPTNEMEVTNAKNKGAEKGQAIQYGVQGDGSPAESFTGRPGQGCSRRTGHPPFHVVTMAQGGSHRLSMSAPREFFSPPPPALPYNARP